jgi:hypothetical protein
VLTEKQVDDVLARQNRTGEPFGLICERLFDVSPRTIESVWAEQYAGLTRQVDLTVEHFEDRAIELVTRRQAWQFRILPIRFDTHELLVATTQEHLPRALRFATNVIGVPIFFVLAEPGDLGAALCRHYPIAGMKPESVHDDAFERILAQSNEPGE